MALAHSHTQHGPTGTGHGAILAIHDGSPHVTRALSAKKKKLQKDEPSTAAIVLVLLATLGVAARRGATAADRSARLDRGDRQVPVRESRDRPAIADTGIYLKMSGPGFFDADFYQRSYALSTPTPPSSPMPALPLATLPPVPVRWGWSAEV